MNDYRSVPIGVLSTIYVAASHHIRMEWTELLGVVGGTVGLASPFAQLLIKRAQERRDRVTIRSEDAAQHALATIAKVATFTNNDFIGRTANRRCRDASKATRASAWLSRSFADK